MPDYWLNTTDYCTWRAVGFEGVICNAGDEIYDLQLGNKGIQGELNLTIPWPTTITTFRLYGNSLNNTNLSFSTWPVNTQSIGLSGNDFSGTK